MSRENVEAGAWIETARRAIEIARRVPTPSVRRAPGLVKDRNGIERKVDDSSFKKQAADVPHGGG